jgi:hypothetical protein
MALSGRNPLLALEDKIKETLPSLEFRLQPGTDVPATEKTFGTPLEVIDTGNTLKLGYFGITNSEKVDRKEVEKLFSCLQTDNQITSILANGSYIDDAGATVIANFLKNNSSLRVLDLHYSHISQNGLLAIVDALQSNDSLEYLNIRANNVTNEVLNNLYLILQQSNICLRQIELSQNNFQTEKDLDQDLIKKIYEQLPTNLLRRKQELEERTVALTAIAEESKEGGVLNENLPPDLITLVSSFFHPRPVQKTDEPNSDEKPSIKKRSE